MEQIIHGKSNEDYKLYDIFEKRFVVNTKNEFELTDEFDVKMMMIETIKDCLWIQK